MTQKKATQIDGCFELFPVVQQDNRGNFIKTFHEEEFRQMKFPLTFKEEYYSTSYKGVLRGLHFQLPPAEHEKVVYCPYGRVLDAVVDLRKDSASYGSFVLFELNAEVGNMLYIPKGMAHGFYTLSDKAIMMYKVTSVYSPEHDSGILWNSVGIPWPDTNPILSKRDEGFIALNDFVSPF